MEPKGNSSQKENAKNAPSNFLRHWPQESQSPSPINQGYLGYQSRILCQWPGVKVASPVRSGPQVRKQYFIPGSLWSTQRLVAPSPRLSVLGALKACPVTLSGGGGKGQRG